jgi:hypothetical protein
MMFKKRKNINSKEIFLSINKAKISDIKGFLDELEADYLYRLVLSVAKMGPCLEIGSYCGKSAVYLGTACRETGSILYSIDHHCGSEEQQPGETYFDPELFDKETGKIDTLRFFRQTIARFDLEDAVVPIIGRSETVGKYWRTPLSFVFIDGSHAYKSVLTDYETWSKHVLPKGYLVFHDIFPDPARGGQAPYQVYQQASASGLYDVLPIFKTLGILKHKR